MHIKTRGIILREVAYKDADKILTVLTEQHGCLTVSAHGVRRGKNRSTAATQQFALVELELMVRQERYRLQEGQVLDLFVGLRRDIRAVSLAAYMAAVLEAVSDADFTDDALFRLGFLALHTLNRDGADIAQIKAAFEFRVLCTAGFAPDVFSCICGKSEPQEPIFHLEDGRVYCKGCNNGSSELILPLCAGSLQAIGHIVSCDLRRIFAFTLGHESTGRFCMAAERFLLEKLDKTFRTLDFYRELL